MAGFSGREDDQQLQVSRGATVAFTWYGTHNVYLLRDRASFGSFGSGSPCERVVLGDWDRYAWIYLLDQDGGNLTRMPINPATQN